MRQKLDGKKLTKNFILSILVQVVSLAVGFVLNLVVPKFISEIDYSHWQKFILYSEYLGILHFGLLDGIVLRYSQYDYDELNKGSVRNQYYCIMVIDAVLSALMAIGAFVFFKNEDRIIFILLAIATCIKISYSYLSFTFQTTNRIKEYAKYVMTYRVSYCILIVVFLVSGNGTYLWLSVSHIVAELIAICFFGIKYSKKLILGSLQKVGIIFPELKATLSSGIWLMISSYAANFVIGSGKMIVEWYWDTLTFGKVSLAFSLSSLVLQFVTAISVVLFPTIKRMDPSRLPQMYRRIRNVVSPLLFMALLLYYPGCVIMRFWLPRYTISLSYLGILMPIIIFLTKTSLLTNNYLKAYRKERTMLFINVAAVGVGFLIFYIIAQYIGKIELLLGAIVLVLLGRSIVSELVVMKMIKIKMYGDFLYEIVLSAIFVACAMLLTPYIGCLVYGASLSCYLVIKRKDILELLTLCKRVLIKSKRRHTRTL